MSWASGTLETQPQALPPRDGAISRAAAGYLYVGDNAHKDFLGARSLGWRTVRIHRPLGEHAAYSGKPAEAAEYEIKSLLELRDLVTLKQPPIREGKTMDIHANSFLRMMVLPVLKLTAFDFSIAHHWTGDRLRLNSFRHKGYWYHGWSANLHHTITGFGFWLRQGIR